MVNSLNLLDKTPSNHFIAAVCADVCRAKRCQCGGGSVSAACFDICRLDRCDCSSSMQPAHCIDHCRAGKCNCGGMIPATCSD